MSEPVINLEKGVVLLCFQQALESLPQELGLNDNLDARLSRCRGHNREYPTSQEELDRLMATIRLSWLYNTSCRKSNLMAVQEFPVLVAWVDEQKEMRLPADFNMLRCDARGFVEVVDVLRSILPQDYPSKKWDGLVSIVLGALPGQLRDGVIEELRGKGLVGTLRSAGLRHGPYRG